MASMESSASRSLKRNSNDDDDDIGWEFGNMKERRTFGSFDQFATSSSKGVKENNKQSDLNDVVREEEMSRVKEYICRWAYQCGIPFHAFENDSFKTLMDAVGEFGPDAMPPTSFEMGDTFLKEAVERTKTSLKKYEEEWRFTGCSVMIDAWSDGERRIIMNFCVNSALGTVFLSSKECLDEAHTHESIFEYVDKCIEEVGVENVVQVVTNHSSNNIGASKLLKEKRPTIFWTSCATHAINLMLEAIGELPRYKETLDQAKKLTVFMYSHHKTYAMMRRYTKKRNIVRPGVTKFASTFLTLQSLLGKMSQLKHMFSSDEWKNCKFANTVKGKVAYETVKSPSFWSGVTICLRIFAPLVRVLRMVDADSKPSMGFIYGELQRAKKEIINALKDNKSGYEPIIDIISKESTIRLDTCLHLTAYILNPYYFYNNPEVRDDLDANDALIDFVGVLFPEDYDMQNKILLVELPMYKRKQGKFGCTVALKACEVNDDKFNPANWWETFGNSTPNLKRIATRILSLTTSSSGCERNWSMFERAHTKSGNRLKKSKMNDLAFVHFNANLMEKNKKRKVRNYEVLIAEDGIGANEWIVDDDVDEALCNRTRARTSASRELIYEEFDSEDEEHVDVEVEYESDGVQIME